MTWKSVIAMLGGEVVLMTAVGWLVKTLITKWIEQDTERFKSKIQLSTSVEIERLKNSLQIVALEHQVRFTKLHERRAEVLAELYERLVSLVSNMQDVVFKGGNIFPEQQKEFDMVSEGAEEIVHFVDAHRIYLPETVCATLDKFTSTARERVGKIGQLGRRFQSMTGEPPAGGSLKERGEIMGAYAREMVTAFDTFWGEIPLLLGVLEKEFRAILGADSSSATLERKS